VSVRTAGEIAAAKAALKTFVEPDEIWLQSRNILSECSSPQIAIAHLQLFCPELVNYRGGWFLADNFDEGNADIWFGETGATVAGVEAMLNHIHLQYDTFGSGRREQPEMTNEEAMAFGEVLAYHWKNWARDAYNLDIQVYLSRADEANADVQIWFETLKVLS